MEKYFEEQDVAAPGFDTAQFSDVQLVGALSEFQKTRKILANAVGVGGSIIQLINSALSDGRVYFSAADKHVYCVSLEGKEVWRFKTEDIVFHPPALDKGVAYVGSYDGNVYALDCLSGQEKWRFQTQGKVMSRPVPFKGRLFVSSADKNIYCLALDGKKLWSLKTSEIPFVFYSSVEEVTYKDWVFFSTIEGGKVYPVDLQGRVPWTFSTTASYTCFPTVVGETLYFGSQDRNIYALDVKTGAKRWAFPCKDTAYVMSATEDMVYGCSRDFNVYGISPEGRQVWTFPTKGMLWNKGQSPQNGVLYVGSCDNNVYALEAATGRKLWEFKTQGPVWGAPLVAKERVLFGSFDCNLYCLDLQGRLLWKFPTSMSTPSQIDVGEASTEKTLSSVITPEESIEEEDRYRFQALGQESGISSQYVNKQTYIKKSTYTKARKIKSMSSGWEED